MPSLLYGLSSLQTVSLKLFGHKVFGQIVIGPIDLQGMNPVLDDLSLLLFVLGLDHMYHIIYPIIQWLTNYSLMLLCLIRLKILEDVTTAIIWTKEKQGTNVWPQRSQASPFMWEVHETDGAAAFQADTVEQHLCSRDNLPCSTSTFTALQNPCTRLIPAPWIRRFSRDSVEADRLLDVFCVSGWCERNAIPSRLGCISNSEVGKGRGQIPELFCMQVPSSASGIFWLRQWGQISQVLRNSSPR